jgi:hypothetical protein
MAVKASKSGLKPPRETSGTTFASNEQRRKVVNKVMYTLVSFTPRGSVVRNGLSLCHAYKLLRAIGRGAIFRSDQPDPRAAPIYPRWQHPMHRRAA